VRSKEFCVGGHLWRVHCFPRGNRTDCKGEYISIFLALASKSENVKAMFDVFLLNRDGTPSLTEAHKFQQVFQPEAPWGWQKFVKRSHLELTYTTNGVARFVCGVIVFNDNDMPMPQHDIGIHFGNLLDCTIGSDVSFVVGGETFPAHRVVLAARSPVFKAELFGSMADATMPSITVQDMEPAVFKLMLWFMYTDSFPADTELGDSPTDLLQHLLVAADRYALDRLKLICSLKLTKKNSVNTVGSILVFAETYNCPVLKNKCLDFFAVEKNFKEAVFTDGFAILLQKFPSLAAELRRRVVI
jgi:speckle-type POZ protein